MRMAMPWSPSVQVCQPKLLVNREEMPSTRINFACKPSTPGHEWKFSKWGVAIKVYKWSYSVVSRHQFTSTPLVRLQGLDLLLLPNFISLSNELDWTSILSWWEPWKSQCNSDAPKSNRDFRIETALMNCDPSCPSHNWRRPILMKCQQL